MSEPTRTCVGCGRKAPQRELARFAAPDGVLVADPARTLPGRGAYTCRRLSCFERAESRRAFARALRRTVTIPSGLKTSVQDH
ncbi:MAG TPA: YlxR family protein [Gaiellaceae bacterium]|nr:YlxR family protein [Gaiellaceae bacterium]